jgi:LysR family transcriptional regulator, hydrogen peroxide-inducible genes activator
MTLTQLRYMVAVARERHFARAAAACFVSQPTLSVAVKKLEEELGIALFERNTTEVGLTDVGRQIVTQALQVLEQADAIPAIAKQRNDPLADPLRLGTIFTIGPYLLPQLVPSLRKLAPQMPLFLEETFTARLLELLKNGEIDAAILALPFSEAGIETTPLYDEDFMVAMPAGHGWEKRKAIPADDLKKDTMLLLGAGHCFRDQVLQVCPEISRFSGGGEGLQKTFEGSSLETIRHMVASGVGLTVMPASAVPANPPKPNLLSYRPFAKPIPTRRVVLAWRASFPRGAAIEAVRKAVERCRLNGTHKIAA